MRMRSLTITHRLALTLGAASLAALGLALAVSGATGRAGQAAHRVAEDILPASAALADVETGQAEVQRELATLLVEGLSAEVRGQRMALLVQAEQRVERGRAAYARLPHPGRQEPLWAVADPGLERWLAEARTLRELLRAAESTAAAGLRAQAAQAYAALLATAAESDAQVMAVMAENAAAAAAARAEEDAALVSARGWLVGGMLAGLGGALAVALLVIHLFRSELGRLGGEASRLTEAVQHGRLDLRADPSNVLPDFVPMLEAMNGTLDALLVPMTLTAACVERIGRGDLPGRLNEPMEGDFAGIQESLNGCIAAVSGLVEELGRVAEAHERGDTDAALDVTRFDGAFAEVARGVNRAMAGHLADTARALAAFDAFGRGDFAVTVERLPGKKAAIHETVERVRANLDGFLVATRGMSAQQEAGDLDAAIPLAGLQGDWRAMAEGVNAMAARNAALLRKVLAAMDGFGQGDFSVELAPLPGKQRLINETVERVRGHLQAVIADADAIAVAAREGRLDFRVDPERHEGDFRRIVAGLNGTFDALYAPLDAAANVLMRMAARDITARVDARFAGDHATFIDAVNGTADALASALAQVTASVQQVSAAADGISDAAGAVARNANAQAGAVERITAQLGGIGEEARRSAEGAARADGLARQARDEATGGAAAMEGMTSAMARIRASAESTSGIIKDINDIAFQTNLLALNAAVEAARAGDAGRGFAVVAEEVRTLAQRAKDAAQRTEALIRQSVQQANEGEGTARTVEALLARIREQVNGVTEAVSAIAASSRGQTEVIASVGRAVSDVDRAMQQTATSAEQSSAAAVVLNGQAEDLGGMVGTFRLETQAPGGGGAPA